jgi:hypothetical protein
MTSIKTELTSLGTWLPVNITLKNIYSKPVDINQAVVSFLNPHGLNGAPWGTESTGGSLSVKTTPQQGLQKTQITLNWDSAHQLNPNQTVTISFTLAGEVKTGEFTEVRTDLIEDPTAPLSFFLKAPQAPEETTIQQVKAT